MTSIDAGLTLLRVCLGLTMAAHGYGKFFRGGRIPGTARWFDSIGMRPGTVQAWLAAGTEVGSGILLALGLLTPFAAAAFVSLMAVAAWTVHREHGFFIAGNGWEYNLILAVGAISVAVGGAGRISLDWAIFGHNIFDGWAGLAVSVVLGLGAAAALLGACYRPVREPGIAS
ncbi:DoxX family protein [Nocardia sp. NBC_00565]|uniref:DoxX family protein n=1 Tax=Nocardia sp. NBC_00565 TaxID=2975993 RepID=UPI002E7FE99E|nr:DoxX family protein [Nocardia sp. NBC_00565]WUC04766.1 DoxX family protein [Nocardia sp. NBC_00565]